MRDYALLASVIVAFAVPALLERRRWKLRSVKSHIRFLDVVMGPAAFALVAGRVVTLTIDDRRALSRVADFLVVRSGVEFWPALAVALGSVAWRAHHEGVRPFVRLADLTPLAMVGYGTYEAGCVWRDGCFGPRSPLGLHPAGIATRMLPVGILVGALIALAAVGLQYLASRISSAELLLAALAVVAGVRAIASFWLPHLGDGLTRQHRTSIAVAVAATVSLAAMELARGWRKTTSVAVRGPS